MAITFSRLTSMKMTLLSGGAVRPLAYTARTKLHDPHFDVDFDYSRLKGDYACGDVIVPDGHPPTFKDLGVYAASLDAAERTKIRTPLEDRERLPQVGLALVVALPPNDELWLPEAAELMQRIVTAPTRANEVAIHWAIHEAKTNRHGHAWYALRAFDTQGNASRKLRDFMVQHRSTALGANIVEGVDWPSLTWEIQQTFFEELGLDLVVDPIAPVPGIHYAPVVYVNGMIHNERSRQRVARSRERAHAANVEAILNSPAELVETLLRGRSTIRILELERLCTRFFDHPADRVANVERILMNDDVVSLADNGAEAPRFLTTRRVHALMKQATDLVDNSSEDQIATVTTEDGASLVREIAERYHALNHPDRPLILGHALSHCQDVALALEADTPAVGTIDMAVTGSGELLALGRERDLALRQGRLVIVPRADLIDDQRVARVLPEANEQKTQLILGHNQSSSHGVVHRHLAAYVADRVGAASARYGRNDIERLLRAGLVRRAIEAMVECGLISFGEFSDHGAHDPSLFVACQDRRRIKELADTIGEERVRAKALEPPEELTTLRGTLGLSVGEWIVTTEACKHPRLQAGEFAEIVAIDRSNSTIEIMHDTEIKRINLEAFAAIRSATTITIREARRLPAHMRLAVELTESCRTWASLLLVARRHEHARLHVDPALARSVETLTDIARRSLPGALPHHREMEPHPNAEISQGSQPMEAGEPFEPAPLPEPADLMPVPPPSIHLADRGRSTIASAENGKNLSLTEAEDPFGPEPLPEPVAAMPPPPPPIHLEERVRGTIASNIHVREGYRLLYHHIGPHNLDRRANAARILGLCTSDLTAALVRFLADLEPQRNRGEFDDYDMPAELTEHDPIRWTLIEIQNAKYDLQTMALPGSNWGLRPPFEFPVRESFLQLFEHGEMSTDEIQALTI